MYNKKEVLVMGFYDNLKNKIFPDEKEVLYYSSDKEKVKESEPTYTNYSSSSLFTPTSFSQTRLLADKLKRGNTVTIDVTNMDKKDALRMIDFLGGVIYSLDGDMKKISKNIFEFSIPSNDK